MFNLNESNRIVMAQHPYRHEQGREHAMQTSENGWA